MLASRPSSRSIALAPQLRPWLPRAVDIGLGSVLELVINAFEDLRERVTKLSLR